MHLLTADWVFYGQAAGSLLFRYASMSSTDINLGIKSFVFTRQSVTTGGVYFAGKVSADILFGSRTIGDNIFYVLPRWETFTFCEYVRDLVLCPTIACIVASKLMKETLNLERASVTAADTCIKSRPRSKMRHNIGDMRVVWEALKRAAILHFEPAIDIFDKYKRFQLKVKMKIVRIYILI